MGVPYKIDRKVVEFIIKKKAVEPNLGCRHLALLIKEQFGVDISKSSVNSVIKEADLSKRVGRPRKARKPEIRFPQEAFTLLEKLQAPVKPEQVLPEKTQKIELPQKPEIPAKPIILPEVEAPKPPQIVPIQPEEKISPEPLKPVPAPEIPLEEEPKKPILEEKPKPEPIQPAPVEAPQKKKTSLADITSFLQPIPINENEVLDSLGAYFLKAAEWEISKASILGNIVREFMPEIEPKQAEIKSNILLYFPAFDILTLKNLDNYDKPGLWMLTNSQEKLDSLKMTDFLQKLKEKEKLISRLNDECLTNFQEAQYYKFVLSDGSGFYIDARLKSLWQEPNIPDSLAVSLNKASNYIDNIFVQFFTKNVQTVLLFNVPSFRSFSPMVSEFIYTFEDFASKRIIQVDICNFKKEVLKSYRNIVPAKRFFVFGFWPWQKEAAEFLKGDIGIVKDFYFSELARKIYYTERIVEFPQATAGNRGVALNLIFLKNSAFSSPRMGFLTNIPTQLIDTQEVIKSFLLRWPNFEDTYQDLMASSERLTYRGFVYPVFDEEKAPKKEQGYIQSNYPKSLDENLKTMLANLSTATQRHFFPYGYRFADFSTMKSRFYSLAGRLARKDNHLYVSLLPAKGYAYNNDLLYAARRVNESEILDPFGYKLWFKVL